MVRYIFRMSRTLFETQCKLLVFERPIILFFLRGQELITFWQKLTMKCPYYWWSVISAGLVDVFST